MKKKFSLMGRVAIALVLALSLTLVMAVPVSAQGALTGVSALPDNDMAGATTTYTIAFTTTAPTGDIASVDMEFAAGFTGTAVLVETDGIGAGTLTDSSLPTVTYTVTEPAAITTGTSISITLSGIVNPSAGSYPLGVTITTRNLAGGAIDTGSAAVTITAAPVSFLVEVGSVTAGTPFLVTITAKDEAAGAGDSVAGYNGPYLIDFTSTATDATIPAFEEVPFDKGVGTTSKSFVLNKVETGRTITATDNELGVTGVSEAFDVNVGDFGYLAITDAPASVIAGVAFADDITVTAYDAAGNVRTDDVREVVWTTTATAFVLPSPHNLEAGTWTFLGSCFTLKTTGTKTITATVGDDSRVASIIVHPAAASKLVLGAAVPDKIDANGYDSSVITATVKDEFDNTVTTSTADITFETSVGQFANGASTYIKAAVKGVAKATLTSTDEGKATVKVTSGTLTYDTVAVELTADTAPTEVWVDDGYTKAGYNDGHDWDVDAFDAITEGIGAVAAGGTVNVAPGAYSDGTPAEEVFPLVLAKDGVTLQATGSTALTIITAPAADDGAIRITADDVTVDGFTIIDSSKVQTAYGILCVGADDAIVRNNAVNFTTSSKGGIDTGTGTGVTVSGNTLNEFANMTVHGSDSMLSGNTFGDCINFWALGTLEGVTITGNTFSAKAGTAYGAINVMATGTSTIDDTLIEGNTLSGRQFGIWVGAHNPSDQTITNLTITGNDITNNAEAGIYIHADVTWGAGNAINNNNIYGNDSGIDNNDAAIIDAENNWWGDASGPYHEHTNSAATGDTVSDKVDYTPWRTSEYTEPVAPVTTIDLVAGWNFISVPKRLALESDTFGVLLTGISCELVYSYDPDAGWTEPFTGTVQVLEGYWIKANEVGTITLVYATTGQQVPPDKSLKGNAWNAIGSSSTALQTAANTLKSIDGSWSTIIGWDADGQAYEDAIIAGTTGDMLPGKGYWIWMTEQDVLSAISG